MARRIAEQLLSSYLLIWAPGTFALEFLSTLPTIGMRGAPAWIELAVHGAVAMVCAAAGWMMRTGAPAAPSFAVAGIVARAAVSAQSLFWTTLPQDVAPGARGVLLILICVNAAVWLAVVWWGRKRSDAGV